MKTRITILLLALICVLVGCTPQAPAGDAPDPALAANAAAAAEPTPVYGDRIADGVYEISVDSSSSMFRVVKCELTVAQGEMTAVMTMSGQGYGMVYMGTGEQALADSEDAYIPFAADDDGAKTFTVPVEALNVEMDCAAWSIKKEKWYDRVLVFESDLIPAEAIAAESD